MQSTTSFAIPEVVLKVITPGPLSLPVKFNWRVLTSWFAFYGLLGGLLGAFTSISIPESNIISAFFYMGAVFPIALTIYGFLGLGIDLMRGNKLCRTGWYWYLYPIVAVIWVALGILVIIVKLLGGPTPKRRYPKIRYEVMLKELAKMTPKELLQDFGKDAIKFLETNNHLKPEEKILIARIRDLLLFQPNTPLKQFLNDREFHILGQGIGIPTFESYGIEVYNVPQPVLQ